MSDALRKSEEPSFDEYIFCCSCCDYVYEYCSIHGPLLVVPDDKVPSPTGFPPSVPRAALTLPRALLHLAPSLVPGGGIGVFSSVTLPEGVRFGPYRGVKRRRADSAYCWQMLDRWRARSHVVDAGDAARANWLRYVRCAREHNLAAFQYRGKPYYRTVRVIPPFTELLVFCGSNCAQAHGAVPRNHAPSTISVTGHVPAIEDRKPTDDPAKSVNLTADEPTDVLNYDYDKKEEKKQDKLDGNDKQIISNNFEEPRSNDECTNVSVNNTQNQSYICDDCNKAFHEKALLISHIAAHKTMKGLLTTHNLRWLCASCNAKFPTKSELINHEINDHGSKIKYNACTLCNYKTIDSSRLKRHIKTHSDEKPFTCNICDTKLRTNNSLKRHVKTHTGDKTHPCKICSAKFDNISSLKKHRISHTDEMPYACEICNSKFKRSYDLKRHALTHNRLKPYRCELCHLKFNQNSILTRHMKTHTDPKPYVCAVCNSEFTKRNLLTRHSRIHTGIKPYNCTICSSKFRDGSSLKRHLKIHADKNCMPMLPATPNL